MSTELRARWKEMMIGLDGTVNVTFTVQSDPREAFQKLHDKELSIEIKEFRKRRSLDANACCWAICDKIGKAISPPIPKEDVYRRAIRDVGEYEPLPIRDDAAEAFCEKWAHKGVGWFADIVGDSKLSGYKLVFAYYGSSVYSTSEMSILVDYLVDEAKQMGLTILTKSEIELLKSEWQ